ncbi:MAG: hypothetical protein HY063_09525 [Bacteroidetes bacterium]|nr:hypothetical protein [Bacteroidota bacterium]
MRGTLLELIYFSLKLFTKGKLIFALIFLLLFIVGMIWAYRADAKVNRMYYQNVWKILVSMILILGAIFLLVKLLH